MSFLISEKMGIKVSKKWNLESHPPDAQGSTYIVAMSGLCRNTLEGGCSRSVFSILRKWGAGSPVLEWVVRAVEMGQMRKRQPIRNGSLFADLAG